MIVESLKNVRKSVLKTFKRPAYFKPECMSVKIEEAVLDITASFQYNSNFIQSNLSIQSIHLSYPILSIPSNSSMWMREKSCIKEVEAFHVGTLECLINLSRSD